MASRFLKQHGTNVAIITAMGAVAAWILINNHGVTTGEREGRKSNVIKIYRPDDLTEITVHRDGATFRVFRKSTDADAGTDHLWRVEENGKDVSADPFSVDKVLSTLEFAYLQRSIKPEEVNRAQFGLEKSRLTLSLKMGKMATTLTVGGDAPKPEASEYVEVDGQVMVAKKETLAGVDLPADAYRTRTIIPYLSSELSGFAIETAGKKHTIARATAATWKFGAGDEGVGRIDRGSIDKLLTSWADLKAETFLPEDEAKRVQAAASDVVVKLTMQPTEKDKTVGELTIGGTCPGHPDDVVVVRTSPSAIFACTGKGVYEALRAGPQADRHPFTYRDDEVEELLLEADGKKLELARKDKGWHERAPQEAQVAVELVKAMLKSLTTAQADAVGTSQSPPSLTPPRGKVTLHAVPPTANDHPPEIVDVGHDEPDGRVAIRRADDGVVLWLSKEQAHSFLPRETALRGTRVVDVGVDKIKSLTIHSDDVNETLEHTADGIWSLADPKGFSIDLATTNSLAEAISHLSADSWVADHDDGSYGFAKPRVRIELATQEEKSRPFKVLLGDTGALGLYGKLEGLDGVFVVPRATEETFRTWAIDLTSFIVDVSSVATVSLKSGKHNVTIASSHDQYVVADGGTDMPRTRLDAIGEALHDLRAEGVVHLGASKKAEGLDSPMLEITVTRPTSVGDGKPFHMIVGAGDSYRGTSIFYARRDGIDAVFAIPAARIRAILAALGLAMRGASSALTCLGAIFTITAEFGCGSHSTTRPIAVAPPSSTRVSFRYDVRAGEGAKELFVEANLSAGSGEELSLEEGAEPFVHDVELWKDASWQPVVARGTSWFIASCPKFGCRVRYRFLLSDAVRALGDIDRGMGTEDAYLAAPSTWLLHPLATEGEGDVTIDVQTPPGITFVTGMARANGASQTTYAITIDDLPIASYSGFGVLRTRAIQVPGGEVDIAIAKGQLALSDDALAKGIETDARAVAGYYGHYPMPRAEIIVVPGKAHGLFGMTLGNGGGAILLQYGRETTAKELLEDWVITHEMVHLALPSVARESHWLEEGLATYVEPLARRKAGIITDEKVWRDLVEGLPQGEPGPGDQGLDRTHTWGRTYWGGALFCVVADVTLREQTKGKFGLGDALRGIAKEGGDLRVRWPIERVLDTGDRATGTSVLHDLYTKMATAPAPVDLKALFEKLGVVMQGTTLTFDDTAPLAWVRRDITAKP